MHKALGAHIYAGGFTVGVSKHFDVVGHLEHAAYGKEVVELNFPGLPVVAGGPAAWKPFIDALPRGHNRVRFLIANPPCALWASSSHGRSTAWHEDPRLQLHHDVMTLLPDVEPDVMAVESVPPFFTKGRSHVDRLIADAKKLGYSSTVVKHDAKWMGVPQARKRVFLVFHRVAIDWDLPAFDRVVTVREAFRGLPKKTKGYDPSLPKYYAHDLVAETPPGHTLRDTFDRKYPNAPRGENGNVIGRPSFLDIRFPWDAPGPIVIGGKSLHPDQPRFLNQEELAAICSFPQDYKWPSSSFGDISSLMSRGVMPKVGEWLAENVARALDEGKRLNQEVTELVDAYGPPGTIEDLPVAIAVPELPWDAEPKQSRSIVEDIHKMTERVDTRPRALLTGSTPMQVGSERTQLKIITAAVAWRAALEDMGYNVDHRPVTPGENVSEYDVVISMFNKSNSIASQHFYGALWTVLKRADAIIALDDWQVFELIAGFQTFARSRERAFRLRGGDLPTEIQDRLFGGILELADPGWRWPIVAPVLGEGDVSLLDAPSRHVTAIDPTVYTPRYPYEPARRREKRWVQASLHAKVIPTDYGWPVEEYGALHRQKGGAGPHGDDAQPRLPESELMKVYAASWGVLSPAHPHAGSGWWRVRYLMAADAGAILSADPREAACLGEAYVEASDPRRVERLSLAGLQGLAQRQKERLAAITWPKERVKKALRDLIKSVEPLRPLATPQAATQSAKIHVSRPVKAPARVSARPEPQAAQTRPAAAANGARKFGSGARIREMLLQGVDTATILATIHREFPGSKAGPSDVSWNKQKLRKDAAARGEAAPL